MKRSADVKVINKVFKHSKHNVNPLNISAICHSSTKYQAVITLHLKKLPPPAAICFGKCPPHGSEYHKFNKSTVYTHISS